MLSSFASFGKSICGEREACVSKVFQRDGSSWNSKEKHSTDRYAMILSASDHRMRRDATSIKRASPFEAGHWNRRRGAKTWMRNDCD